MKRLMILSVLTALVALMSCANDPTTPDTARVSVLLTDAPLDLSSVSAVEVTLSEMILYPADDDSGGMEMVVPLSTAEGMTLNLLEFQNGKTITIATLDVPAGSYEKLRMGLVRADLLRDDDGNPDTPDLVESIFIPSGKVDIPVPFTATAGEELEVVLDFDAALSVQVNTTQGQHPYILRPVITPTGVAAR